MDNTEPLELAVRYPPEPVSAQFGGAVALVRQRTVDPARHQFPGSGPPLDRDRAQGNGACRWMNDVGSRVRENCMFA